jgi:hypothetical protein
VNRATAVILALGALAVSAALVSIGSWVLLVVERRRRRVARPTEPSGRGPHRPETEPPGSP